MIEDVVYSRDRGKENADNDHREVQGFTTPSPTTKSLSAQKEKGIKNVLEKISEGRKEVMEATKEILDIMRRSASNRGSTSESELHEIVDQINS
jgi:hypothetical protein